MRLKVQSTNYDELVAEIMGIEGKPHTIEISDNYTGNTIPEDIFAFDSIVSITIKSRTVEELPQTLAYSSRLKRVTMNNTRVSQLPKELYNSESIKELILSSNKISQLSDHINNMKSLTRLSIDWNELRDLPNLSDTSLEIVSTLGNPIQSVDPKQFPTKIKSLLLGGEISPISDFSHLQYLERLTLNDERNALESIRLPLSIKYLFINSPKSTSFPSGIEDLPNLVTFNWNGGQLSNVVINGGTLPSLRNLALLNCGLSKVPEGIELLPNLRELNLENNKIETLDRSFSKVKKLLKLNLSNNPIRVIDEHALDSLRVTTVVTVDENLRSFLFEVFPDIEDRVILELGGDIH